MTVYAQDSMLGADGTDLASHTPDIGGPWTAESNLIEIESNAAARPASGFAYYACGGSPATADYTVSAEIHNVAGWACDNAGVLGRIQAAGFGLGAYFASYDFCSSAWRLDIYTPAGYFSALANVSYSMSVGETHTISLIMGGSTIEVDVDGSAVISVTDTTLTGIGLGGIAMNSTVNDFDITLDNFVVSDSASTPGVHVVSGIGEISISSPTWIEVACTDIPPALGRGNMDPVNYWKLGTLAWGTDNGLEPPRQIIFANSIFELPNGMSVLSYKFAGGVLATITERITP